MMGKFPLSNRKILLLTFVASFFSIFTLATIPTLPMDNANAIEVRDTCTEIDNGPNDSFCDYDRDISTDYYDDCINNVNCLASTNFYWQNDERNTYNNQGERADIDVNLDQLLHCDNGDQDCRNDVLNFAFHEVDVRSLGTANSFARFEVDMDMRQATDGHDQDNYIADNAGAQSFVAEVRNNAKLLADDAGEDVQFIMDQFNDRPDDSVNLNTGFGTFPAFQSYNIDARGSSIVTLPDEQGFALYQTNDECDVESEDVGDVTQLCINRSDQSLTIDALNTARVTFDNDRSDGGDLSTTTQINGCNAGFDGSEGDLLCENDAITQVGINAIGSSQVNADRVIQDNYQSTSCDDPADSDSASSAAWDGDSCVNSVESTLDINSAVFGTSGRVNINGGVQDSEQTIDCTDGQECKNFGELFVQIGSLAAPVTGTVNTQYSQTLDQDIDECDSVCTNDATITYLANARNTDGDTIRPVLTSTSDQYVSQYIECFDGQVCKNDALMINDVEATEDSQLTADTDQIITQSCSNFYGDVCDNEAEMKNDISSTGSGRVAVTTDQTIIQNCSGQAYDTTCSNVDHFTSTGTNLGQTGNLDYSVYQFDSSSQDRTYTITVNPTAPQPVVRSPANSNNVVTSYP